MENRILMALIFSGGFIIANVMLGDMMASVQSRIGALGKGA